MPDFVAVVGTNAQRVRVLEDADSDGSVEAEALNIKNDAEVVYSYHPIGYIRGDDWSNIQPEQIRNATENGNAERAKAGFPALHVGDWVQQPTYNRDTHTVLWSFNGSVEGGGHIFNATVLKLGRYGFERIVLIDNSSPPVQAMADLLLVADAHQFSPGATYTDYVAGIDRASEYGIAGLVAGVLGVKLVKVGAVVGLAVFAKKLVWLALLPFVWLWRKIRSKKIKKVSAVSDNSSI